MRMRDSSPEIKKVQTDHARPTAGRGTDDQYGGMRPTQRAFSLIELLVVVAIIAVLAGALVALIPRVRDLARTTVCASHQRQIAAGMLTLAQDDRGRLPWSDPYPYGQYPWPGCVAGNTMFSLRDDHDMPLAAWWCRAQGQWGDRQAYIVTDSNVVIDETVARSQPYGGRVLMSYQYFGPYVSGPWSWEVRHLRQGESNRVLLADFTMVEGPNVYANHRSGGRVTSNQAFLGVSQHSCHQPQTVAIPAT